MSENSRNIIEHEAASLSAYVARIIEIATSWKDAWQKHTGNGSETLEMWYRGQSKLKYELTPSAYRDAKDYDSAFERFKSLAHPYLRARPTTLWEWYFTAQHHGIPTRLLDWSEDPLIALHFSMLDILDRPVDSLPERKDLPVVWIIEAASLNAILHQEDRVFVVAGDELNEWLPGSPALDPSTPAPQFGTDSPPPEGSEPLPAEGAEEAPPEVDTSGKVPMAILPPLTTDRIHAQRGRFTIHGQERKPLEQYFRDCKDDVRCGHIAKIVITDPLALAREMTLLGFVRYRLFPELDQLARHLTGLERA